MCRLKDFSFTNYFILFRAQVLVLSYLSYTLTIFSKDSVIMDWDMLPMYEFMPISSTQLMHQHGRTLTVLLYRVETTEVQYW